jgi:rhodanese-related sulfurtransferase
MKRLTLALAFAVVAFSQDASKQTEVRKITDAEDLAQLLKDEKNMFFLDVREPKEIEELGSLKGYVNIPMGELEKRMGEVPKDKTIITA